MKGGLGTTDAEGFTLLRIRLCAHQTWRDHISSTGCQWAMGNLTALRVIRVTRSTFKFRLAVRLPRHILRQPERVTVRPQ